MLSLGNIHSKDYVAQIYQKERRQRFLDATIVILVMLVSIGLGGYFDLYERWHGFVIEHEDWELDEIILGVTSFTLMMIWYAWRRQRYAESVKSLALDLAEEAIQANNAKSQFLASMSHDLRTPLNAIVGFSEVMREELFGPLGSEHYKQYADDIHYSGALLTDLINDVLDLSKVESGDFKLASEKVDVSNVVHLSFRQLEAMAKSLDHNVSIHVSPSLPLLLGDRRVLVQIINNLLSNAIKFTPTGGDICIKCYLDGSNQIIISVADSGVGMSDKEADKALKPFESSNVLIAEKYKGTGLGLYLCKSFMEKFGGSLKLISILGKGTEVLLIFPSGRTMQKSFQKISESTF